MNHKQPIIYTSGKRLFYNLIAILVLATALAGLGAISAATLPGCARAAKNQDSIAAVTPPTKWDIKEREIIWGTDTNQVKDQEHYLPIGEITDEDGLTMVFPMYYTIFGDHGGRAFYTFRKNKLRSFTEVAFTFANMDSARARLTRAYGPGKAEPDSSAIDPVSGKLVKMIQGMDWQLPDIEIYCAEVRSDTVSKFMVDYISKDKTLYR